MDGILVNNVVSVLQGQAAAATFGLTEDNAKKAGPMFLMGPSYAVLSISSCCTCGFECFANMKRDNFMLKVPANRQ